MATIVEETQSPFEETPSPFQRAQQDGLVNGRPNNHVVKRKVGKRRGNPGVGKEGYWIPVFLEGLAEGLSITDAAKIAGVHNTRVHLLRRDDEEFRKQWNEAAEIGTELLEQEAQRRAFHGTLKPVFHKGVECGAIREYSDALLSKLLSARKPEVYRERGDTGGHGGQITVNIFERVAILRQQLEHGNGQPTVISMDARVPEGVIPGDSGREPVDKTYTVGQANGVSAPG
jgi:hypothetical protein